LFIAAWDPCGHATDAAQPSLTETTLGQVTSNGCGVHGFTLEDLLPSEQILVWLTGHAAQYLYRMAWIVDLLQAWEKTILD
jgi:hypothetical protein